MHRQTATTTNNNPKTLNFLCLFGRVFRGNGQVAWRSNGVDFGLTGTNEQKQLKKISHHNLHDF